jgi:SAM-dependent methyltransferase
MATIRERRSVARATPISWYIGCPRGGRSVCSKWDARSDSCWRRSATLEDAAYPEGAFDLVIQKDLLEHVSHPRRHLLETRRVLRPGGALWLITPNGEANLRPLLTIAQTDGPSGEKTLPLLDQGHLSFLGPGTSTRSSSSAASNASAPGVSASGVDSGRSDISQGSDASPAP